MNYFLELYHIHEYFRRVSSMDTERIAAAESIGLCHDFALDYIIRNLIMTEIPDYYQNESCDEELSCDVIVNELQKRGHLCRRRHRNGISKVKVDIEGKHFVIGPYYKGGWNLHYVPFNFNTKMKGYELKNMPVESLVDMMEDIAAVPDSINQLYRMYLDMICGDFGPEHIQDAETFLTRCAPIQEACKKNSLVEHIAEKHISEVLKKYSPKGIVGMSEVKYACYDSGVILLAPYKRKGAIIGFLSYSRMTALEETISRIMSYNEGSPLPEGFVLYE